jgi:hypothetical protein
MNNEELKTLNALKYLPITVTLAYFLSLPEGIITDMFTWYMEDVYYDDFPTYKKAQYLYDVFEEAADPGDQFYNQLTFYILNYGR